MAVEIGVSRLSPCHVYQPLNFVGFVSINVGPNTYLSWSNIDFLFPQVEGLSLPITSLRTVSKYLFYILLSINLFLKPENLIRSRNIFPQLMPI